MHHKFSALTSRGNSTSTTAPMISTNVILDYVIMLFLLNMEYSKQLQRHATISDNFLRNRCLTCFVINLTAIHQSIRPHYRKHLSSPPFVLLVRRQYFQPRLDTLVIQYNASTMYLIILWNQVHKYNPNE